MIIAIASTYDLVLSQFVPDATARAFPKIWKLAATLPAWAWIAIGAAVSVAAIFEYAYSRILRVNPVSIPGSEVLQAAPSPPVSLATGPQAPREHDSENAGLVDGTSKMMTARAVDHYLEDVSAWGTSMYGMKDHPETTPHASCSKQRKLGSYEYMDDQKVTRSDPSLANVASYFTDLPFERADVLRRWPPPA